MKRVLGFLLIAVLAFAGAACGDTNDFDEMVLEMPEETGDSGGIEGGGDGGGDGSNPPPGGG